MSRLPVTTDCYGHVRTTYLADRPVYGCLSARLREVVVRRTSDTADPPQTPTSPSAVADGRCLFEEELDTVDKHHIIIIASRQNYN